MANQGGTSGENAGIAKLSGGKNGGDCDGTAACIDGVSRAELEDPLLSSVARNLREISATLQDVGLDTLELLCSIRQKEDANFKTRFTAVNGAK